MNAKRTFSALMLVALSAGAAAAAPDDDAWKPYQFLVGEWTAKGGGEPGKGSGRFSFAWDLQEKVLVRRNRAEYPASQGRPAALHEDLMVIYRADGDGPTKAIYFDSEGHVINYAVTFSDDKRTLTFLSDAIPAAPRFRLSYTKGADDSMGIKFEIAPPGKPDGFKTYLEGDARRQTEPKLGKPKIGCDATDIASLTAGNCDKGECCPQEEKADAPKRKGKTAAPAIDRDRQIVFKVEGLACPAVNGIGCGHMLRGVLASLDKIDGVEASSANYTGTMIRVSVTPATNRDKVKEEARKSLIEEDRKVVTLSGVELKRALDREEWREAGRIGELSAIEFHTLVLHRVKTFAKAERLDKEATDKLATISEQQWERISKEAKNGGSTQPEEWANRCKKSLPVLLELVKEVLTAEQVERFKNTVTGQCRDENRPEAPPASTQAEKADETRLLGREAGC